VGGLKRPPVGRRLTVEADDAGVGECVGGVVVVEKEESHTLRKH